MYVLRHILNAWPNVRSEVRRSSSMSKWRGRGGFGATKPLRLLVNMFFPLEKSLAILAAAYGWSWLHEQSQPGPSDCPGPN